MVRRGGERVWWSMVGCVMGGAVGSDGRDG